MKREERQVLDMRIFDKESPWEACFRLAEFFESGGVCRIEDGINWRGAAYSCSSKANDILSDEVKMVERLAWAHLSISIYESLGEVGRAMLDRVNMVIRFGAEPGDDICDLDRVVNYFFGFPDVQKTLQENPVFPRRIRDLGSGVRTAAEELKRLVVAGRLNREGEIDKLISIVERAVP